MAEIRQQCVLTLVIFMVGFTLENNLLFSSPSHLCSRCTPRRCNDLFCCRIVLSVDSTVFPHQGHIRREYRQVEGTCYRTFHQTSTSTQAHLDNYNLILDLYRLYFE